MAFSKKIDFIGIGAQKAGTSWLFSNLNEIQEFSLPGIKEFHYFDRNQIYPSPNKRSLSLIDRAFSLEFMAKSSKRALRYIKRQNFKNLKYLWKNDFSNYNDQWYLSMFKNLKGYCGEITPSYSILNPQDIRHMHNLMPDVKIVILLRNPIDRAWSHFRFHHRKKKLISTNLKIDEIIQFMDSERQTLRSDYLRTIDNYLNVFSKEQILIGFFDAIIDDPKMLMTQIIQHICGENQISIAHLKLKKRKHVSQKVDCPEEISGYLKEKYYNDIKELSNRYGGYFNQWYEQTFNEKAKNKNRTLKPTLRL